MVNQALKDIKKFINHEFKREEFDMKALKMLN